MPTITPDLVPTIAPGNLFNRFTTDTSIAIRFLQALDPVFFESLNRPMADIALRQLIIAKTLDQLNLRLGHQAQFPYLMQPKVVSGSNQVDVPLSMIWDMHVSLPKKWEQVRLARIKRVSGGDASATAGGHTGSLRFVFTAQQEGSSTEVAVFQADMQIDGDVLFQVVRIETPTSSEETTPIDPGEAETVDGFIIFRTLDLTDPANDEFLNAVAAPIAGSVGSSGDFTSPAVYEIADSSAPSDISAVGVAHGTGMLIASAWNSIPLLGSDIQVFLNTINFPFSLDADRQSNSPSAVIIPTGLFREFDLVAPAGDEPTGDVSGTYYPVWISRIVRNDAPANSITVYFATYGVGDTPSTAEIEFASMVLSRTMVAGQVVAITPVTDLFGEEDAGFQQGFGRGHAVLSSLWGGTTTEVEDFFDAFIGILDDPAEAVFAKPNTRLSSFGLSRVPKTVPTAGQAQALKGTRDGETAPSASNRFVVEADQGLGEQVDFSEASGLAPDRRNNDDIERYGYVGSLAHRCVKLVVNSEGEDHTYEDDILPRLTILFGRAPKFGDFWYDGTNLKFFNGDTWQT